jgi:hypothetical protein
MFTDSPFSVHSRQLYALHALIDQQGAEPQLGLVSK